MVRYNYDIIMYAKRRYKINCSTLVADLKTSGPGQSTGCTWIHELFQGTLTNETKCLSCETVRSKDEDFLDLSVDVEQNTSLTHCLK